VKNALEYLNRAIELDAALPDAFYFRGMTYQHMGNKIQATKDLNRAKDLRYNPDVTPVRFAR